MTYLMFLAMALQPHTLYIAARTVPSSNAVVKSFRLDLFTQILRTRAKRAVALVAKPADNQKINKANQCNCFGAKLWKVHSSRAAFCLVCACNKPPTTKSYCI